jgi:hypothetical protein
MRYFLNLVTLYIHIHRNTHTHTFSVLGLKLRASHLLGKCSTIWITFQILFAFTVFQIGSHAVAIARLGQQFSYLTSRVAGITGVHNHTQLRNFSVSLVLCSLNTMYLCGGFYFVLLALVLLFILLGILWIRGLVSDINLRMFSVIVSNTTSVPFFVYFPSCILIVCVVPFVVFV